MNCTDCELLHKFKKHLKSDPQYMGFNDKWGVFHNKRSMIQLATVMSPTDFLEMVISRKQICEIIKSIVS